MLLGLFRAHSREGRVIVPLLKSIDLLLSHQCLDELLLKDEGAFKESLLSHLMIEAKNCSDVHRLFACVDVSLGLVVFSDTGKARVSLLFCCFFFLLELSCCKYKSTCDLPFIEINIVLGEQ